MIKSVTIAAIVAAILVPGACGAGAPESPNGKASNIHYSVGIDAFSGERTVHLAVHVDVKGEAIGVEAERRMGGTVPYSVDDFTPGSIDIDVTSGVPHTFTITVTTKVTRGIFLDTEVTGLQCKTLRNNDELSVTDVDPAACLTASPPFRTRARTPWPVGSAWACHDPRRSTCCCGRSGPCALTPNPGSHPGRTGQAVSCQRERPAVSPRPVRWRGVVIADSQQMAVRCCRVATVASGQNPRAATPVPRGAQFHAVHPDPDLTRTHGVRDHFAVLTCTSRTLRLLAPRVSDVPGRQ